MLTVFPAEDPWKDFITTELSGTSLSYLITTELSGTSLSYLITTELSVTSISYLITTELSGTSIIIIINTVAVLLDICDWRMMLMLLVT